MLVFRQSPFLLAITTKSRPGDTSTLVAANVISPNTKGFPETSSLSPRRLTGIKAIGREVTTGTRVRSTRALFISSGLSVGMIRTPM